MLKGIVYVSSAVGRMSKDELLNILSESSENNRKLNITGMLIYYDGTFVQALEGEEAHVNAVMEKVLQDPRHKNIITILDEEIKEREFGDWEMGFRSLSSDELQNLDQFVDLDSFNLSGGMAKDLLKTFYEVNVKAMTKYQF